MLIQHVEILATDRKTKAISYFERSRLIFSRRFQLFRHASDNYFFHISNSLMVYLYRSIPHSYKWWTKCWKASDDCESSSQRLKMKYSNHSPFLYATSFQTSWQKRIAGTVNSTEYNSKREASQAIKPTRLVAETTNLWNVADTLTT